MNKYETFEHTADIGLRIYGSNLKELFTNAAIGLFSLIADCKKVKPTKEIKINLKEENREELFISWLNELIFQFSAHGFLPRDFQIKDISDNSISANIKGEKVDSTRHKILTEIKAATYHELKIENIGNRLKAQVILDT
jgi:SHS2 domain-containing protein